MAYEQVYVLNIIPLYHWWLSKCCWCEIVDDAKIYGKGRALCTACSYKVPVC